METYGINPKRHIIGVNEGNCVALAAGYHLATGKVPVVYMQNSGEGNAINPIASLLNKKVYAIPCIFVIGWRGEPGLHDEPQHIFQGEITLQLLENMGIPYVVLEKVKETGCKFVGLSALMTTTVPSMEETIDKLHSFDKSIKCIVGGAVLTKEYAQMINADFYAKDAMDAVRLAEEYYK